MSAEKPYTGKSLVTAAQCLQNFVSEIQRAELVGPEAAEVAALDETSGTKAYQQAPRGDQRPDNAA